MPGSTISLDSLSSPSPSPSPPPETNKPAKITATGLDTDSELSELTEEEQEAEKQDDDEDENIDEYTDHTSRRGLRPTRRGGRRKRSSIVPAPMWGWAETKTSTVVEEEEEEEMAGPPRAMEEEEDEEEDDDSIGPSFSSARLRKNLIDDERDDHRPDDEEHTPAIDPVDEEESFSGDDGPFSRARRARRSARASRPQDDLDSNSSEDEIDDLRKCEEEQDEDDEEDDDLSDGPIDQPDVESENETESEDEDSKERDTVDLKTPLTTASASKPLKSISTATLMDMDIDLTAPSPQALAPLAAAAAASSIMAGSTVLNAPSPSPSSSSSASGSPTSSRSPSPAPSATVKISELAEANGVARPKREVKQKLNAIDKDTKVPLLLAKDIPTALDMDIDIPEHGHERDRSAEDIEVDEPSPDDDLEVELESDLQPAHRAEALDVLATIELKFALLRERMYVEKMDGLAWEEALVGEGNHPELLHLHRELSKRRDKRIELATRKRSNEVANVTKRRRVDEAATWSWWKLARDDLQTDMISEANRTRRRLERERRAVERPPPVRRIPNPPREAPVPPTLRKIVKSFPFGNRRQNKRDNSNTPLIPLLYPELSTLSSSDISSDLDFLYQHRRPSFEAHRVGSVNMNASFGPQVVPHGYDLYNDGIGMPPPFGMQPPPPPVFQHHALPPLQQPGGGKSISAFPPYGTSGPGPGRIHHQPAQVPPPSLQNHPHHHGLSQFVLDQEVGSATGPNLTHHPYFGSQGGASGSGFGGNTARRSISPVNVMPNGTSAKHNGTWMGAGMGMGTFHGSSKANEWVSEGRRGDTGMNEDEDRERARERDRREKERDREHQELERERQRENYHMQQLIQQQQQHRHPPPPQHQHVHNVSPGQVQHHHGVAPHHHHRPHHHHVLHHHHGQPGAAVGHGTSPLPPGAGPSLSPRASREFDSGRPHSGLAQHPTEIISLSSSKPPIASHWKGDDPQGSSSSDYRDVRNKHGGRPSSGPPQDDRERPLAMPFVMTSTHAMQPSNISPPTSAPPNGTSSPRSSWNAPEDNSFRIPPPPDYLGSHEGPSHSPGHRYTNSSSVPLGGRGPAPSQPPRQNSLGLSPPRPRPHPPPSPSSSSNAYPNPVRSPARFGPPPQRRSRSPPMNLKMHRPSSPTALSTKMSGPPPPLSVYSPRLSGPGRTVTPTGLAPSADIKSSSAPSVTATAYTVGNRTASPVMPFPSPSSHPSLPPPLTSRPLMNSNSSDRDRDRHMSPRLSVLPAPKIMAVPQMVDGH